MLVLVPLLLFLLPLLLLCGRLAKEGDGRAEHEGYAALGARFLLAPTTPAQMLRREYVQKINMSRARLLFWLLLISSVWRASNFAPTTYL